MVKWRSGVEALCTTGAVHSSKRGAAAVSAQHAGYFVQLVNKQTRTSTTRAAMRAQCNASCRQDILTPYPYRFAKQQSSDICVTSSLMRLLIWKQISVYLSLSLSLPASLSACLSLSLSLSLSWYTYIHTKHTLARARTHTLISLPPPPFPDICVCMCVCVCVCVWVCASVWCVNVCLLACVSVWCISVWIRVMC